MRLDGKTTTELTDSGGFEFNTTRPRSQCALDHSAPSNTTPLGANLKLIERARSNRGNTVFKFWLLSKLSG